MINIYHELLALETYSVNDVRPPNKDVAATKRKKYHSKKKKPASALEVNAAGIAAK